MSEPVNPHDVYTDRLALHEARSRRFDLLCWRAGFARLLLAAIVILLGISAWMTRAFSPLWILIPAASFVAAVVYHTILKGRRGHARRVADFYRRGLARLEDRWAGTGNRGERFLDEHHVYAADLDLFGEASLFELLCEAHTRAGEDKLANWLLAPAAIAEVRERQADVADLRTPIDLRERVAVLRKAGPAPGDSERLLAWAESAALLNRGWVREAAYGLTASFVAALVAGAITGIWFPLIAILVVELLALARLRSALRQVLSPAEHAFDLDDLRTLSGILQELETAEFAAPALVALRARLFEGATPASIRVRKLATIVAFSESRNNIMIAWAQWPFLYGLHVALAAERWRRAYGARVRTWIEATSRFEALLSLATYSYEHPDDPFPVLYEGPASLRATRLGHPLMKRARCVRNDVTLDAARVWLVSGSNMSGKSTLLRAAGLNVVLAMAGAPVCAAALDLTPLQVGASIRVNDSLREGASRFYAEITRLRQLMDLAARAPALLFLIDEMLQGTNSHDRRAGAEGVLRGLVARGAIGFATTHDLALTELRGLSDGVLENVHFEDDMHGGRMHFDYKLRAGVVTRSNGLELMRSLGLEV